MIHWKLNFWSLSPPPNFNMRAVQHELRRLAQEQLVIHNKLWDKQAQVSAVESFTPVIREYSAYAVQKADIDSSALLPPVVDLSTTLTQCLAALEEITQRLQEDEQANGAVLQQVWQLETVVWLQEEWINGATGQMDRIEEYAHTRWKETWDELQAWQRDLVEIRTEQERLEAEVRESGRLCLVHWKSVSPSPLGSSQAESKLLSKLLMRSPIQSQSFQSITWSSVPGNRCWNNSLSSTSARKRGRTSRSMQHQGQ